MADRTRSMRKSILDRDILPVFKNRLLTEISADDLRERCNKVKGRGVPATAIHNEQANPTNAPTPDISTASPRAARSWPPSDWNHLDDIRDVNPSGFGLAGSTSTLDRVYRLEQALHSPAAWWRV